MTHSLISKNLQASIDLKQRLLEDDALLQNVRAVADAMIKCYENEGKVLFCGNGGSAADAQHLSAELSGRYYFDRPPLFAEALHVNTSYLTAVANDYSFDHIYERITQCMGKTGDVLIGMSTSGNSRNVILAMKKAQELGMTTVGFTGAGGGKLKEHCDFLLAIPSTNVPRIQECHMLVGHTLCEMVEAAMFPDFRPSQD
ncbi:MAG: D-sedoheptulose 7-phosphate isomerase [Bacteroidota bacterium]